MRFFDSRKSSGPPPPANELDKAFLRFNNAGDALTARDLCAGVGIFGAPGSGKTNCSGAALRTALLTQTIDGWKTGGLVCTVKRGEADAWIEEANALGRGDDVIVIRLAPTDTKNPREYHAFDPLFYEMNRPGRGAGNVANIVALFSAIATVGSPNAIGGSDSKDRFFQQSAESVMRNCIHLINAAGETLSLQTIQAVLGSLPREPLPEEHSELSDAQQRWYQTSKTGQLLSAALQRSIKGELSPSLTDAVEQAIEFLCKDWPELAPETRTSIAQTFRANADKLLEPPFRYFLCDGRCTFVPEQMFMQGKIIILDMPVLEYQLAGRLAQVAVKIMAYQAINRRDTNAYPGLCFVASDECQYLAVKADIDAAQVAREQRLVLLFITQNVNNLATEFGEQQFGSKTKAFTGCLQVKIFHQNGEQDTNEWAAGHFGHAYVDSANYGSSGSNIHQERRYRVEPSAFAQLAVPQPRYKAADAYVWRSGQPWNMRGKDGEHVPQLLVTFPLLKGR